MNPNVIIIKEQWNSSDKGRFCFSIIPKTNNVPWYHDPKCQCGKFHTVDHILFEWHQTRKQSVINKLKTIGYHKPLYIRDIVGVELRKKVYSGIKISRV